jgi:DNA-binding PadR family transcriptional regulator
MAVSKVEVAVLGLLAEGPMHGYDLLERARERGMDGWTAVAKASIYQALHRLERTGAIAGRAQEGPEGPDRRVYRITAAGRRRLRAGLDERFEALGPYETDGGLALGFVHVLPAAEVRRAVDARERAVRGLLEQVRLERARSNEDRVPGRVVADAMLQRQAALATAELGWLEAFRTSLGKLRR